MKRNLPYGVTAVCEKRRGVPMWTFRDAHGTYLGRGYRRDYGFFRGMWEVSPPIGPAGSMTGITYSLMLRRGPVEGVTRCGCGSKYWDDRACHSCGTAYDPARTYEGSAAACSVA
jgi:hypothetical protein